VSCSLDRTTNKVAEYQRLLMGREAQLPLGAEKIIVKSDSQLWVRQLNGEYRVKDERLKVLFCAREEFIASVQKLSYCSYSPRDVKWADRLAEAKQ
jgi:ribonuclease HI